MTNFNETLLFEISDWIIKAMDNALSPEEFDQFQHLLKTNPQAREYYYDILVTHAGIDEIKTIFLEDPSLDLEIWRTLADNERTAPAIIIQKPEQTAENENKALEIEKKARKAYKRSLFVAITSMAALFFAIAISNLNYFSPAASPVEVLTLTDSLNARWQEPDMPASRHIRLATNQHPWTLEKGMVKLRFDSNAQVIIEAPTRFEITSAEQIRLHYGRIYATVPLEAVGFSIKTSNSKIVDLGTEFGVQAQQDGTTELHVVKGKTQLISGDRNKFTTLLTAGIAKRIFGLDAKVSDIPCDQNLFVREFRSKNEFVWRGEAIQLADIVGEGDGFGTGTANIGINPLSGQIEDVKELDRSSDNGYVALPRNSFIDGVFVPNGQTPQVVSSRGNIFKECPVTCGLFYTEIANTPRIVVLNTTENSGNSGFIFMHSNLGITFDLESIRSHSAGLKIDRFESGIYVSEAAPNTPNVDFWVLVDGQLRYSKRNVKQKGYVDFIRIPLSDNSRFLTLIVTDGGDPAEMVLPDGSTGMKGINSDWGVFAQPQLVLK